MLLLAPELLAIAVCAGSAESELSPIDTTDGLINDKLYGAARANALARAATLCRMRHGTERLC